MHIPKPPEGCRTKLQFSSEVGYFQDFACTSSCCMTTMTIKLLLLVSIVSSCIAFYAGKSPCSIIPSVIRGRQGHKVLLEIEVDDDVITGEIKWDETNYREPKIDRMVAQLFARFLGALSPRRIAASWSTTFLPVGFPTTTPPEYLTFQKWNLLQDLCSYLRGIMSTGALLEGMGVGRAEATALQATILWMYRDGAGMLGSLLFTSLSSYNFGQNIKAWRLFADAINNVGITLDMIAPYFRQQFLAIVCAASVCKALCGVAAGATGAAIAEHWGEQHGNIADVLAKNGAQHTIVSMIGLLATVPFATFTSTSPAIAAAMYSALTAVHMFANWRAMRVLALRTLNPSRCHVLLEELLTLLAEQLSSTDSSTAMLGPTFGKSFVSGIAKSLTVPAVATKERIFSMNSVRYVGMRTAANCNISSRIQDLRGTINNVKLWTAPSFIAQLYDSKVVTDAMDVYRECNYFLLRSPQSDPGSVHVCFRRGASGQDQLQAWLEGCLLQLTGSTRNARELCDRIAPLFFAELRAQGWKVDPPLLRPRGARAFTDTTNYLP